jgi:hypothetical protein
LRKGIARAQLGRLRENYAAIHLQSVIRKYAQVQQYRKIRASAVVLQKGMLLLFFCCNCSAFDHEALARHATARAVYAQLHYNINDTNNNEQKEYITQRTQKMVI